MGRLVHGDLAGPFKRSHHGFLYFLVLVDDQSSRFKQVYFLKHKSEVLKRIRSYVAKINALASAGKPEPVRVVGHLHVDNAGEFLSHEFNEYLVSTPSPSHELPVLLTYISSTAWPNVRYARSWRSWGASHA